MDTNGWWEITRMNNAIASVERIWNDAYEAKPQSGDVIQSLEFALVHLKATLKTMQECNKKKLRSQVQ